jgi:predicted secreted hydrolase
MLAALALVAVACARPVAPLPELAAPAPTAAPPLALPRDANPHDALTEWWYYTGHLRSEAGDTFGFEFTVFQARRQGAPSGYLAHFAISDIGGQRFSHQARFVQVSATAPSGFPLDVDGWTLGSEDGADLISAAMQPGPGADPPYRLQLRLVDQKPPAPHHGGYIEYGPAGGSYYYSRTRLSVSGELVQGERAIAVTGLAWMDHQWGNFVVSSAAGWDWYSVQLDDRTELMLYVLRGPSGETSGVYGSQVLPDGTVRELEPGSVTARSTGSWLSPHTGGRYPSGWQLTLPDGQRLELRPQLVDQELYFPGVGGPAAGVGVMAYWEGAVTVSGDRTGVGYVELTGYAGQ